MMGEHGHRMGAVYIIELAPPDAHDAADLPTHDVDGQPVVPVDLSTSETELRRLVQIPDGRGIRGLVTCPDCGGHGLLWFGSHDAVRRQEFVELDSELSEADYRRICELIGREP